jgi:hypothetical protein
MKIPPAATFVMDESPHPAIKNARLTTQDFAMGLVMILPLPLIMFIVLFYVGNLGECRSAIE